MNMTNELPPSVPPSYLLVPAANRYQGAWQEIGARLQSRQFVQATYMTGVVVVLAQGFDLMDPGSWRTPVIWLLTLFTLAVSLWVRHNNSIIGLLGAYCQFLEQSDDEDQRGRVPGWHDGRYKMMHAVLGHRLYSDIAFAVVGLVATAPALFKTFLLLRAEACSPLKWAPFLAPVALGVFAVVTVLLSSKERKKILEQWTFGICPETEKHQWGWRGEIKPFR
jgi:hypothetical protein